jgi:predicted O-methyltransferase YrrM
MRSISNTRTGIEDSLDLAFGFSVGDVSIAPAQIRSEIESLLRRLRNAPPQRILEIGTARGGTLFLLSRVAAPEAMLLSIDLPGGSFGITWRPESTLLLKRLVLQSQTVCLIRADSHDSGTLSTVRTLLNGEPLDLLLIDGDHRYEGARRDFEMYGPLVRARGLIAFHDIVPGSPEKVGGVPMFWQEIRGRYETVEIVDDWGQEGFGIGLVKVPARGLTV